MKTYWGNEGIFPRIRNLGTSWKWVVGFTPRSIYPRKISLGAHWIGRWMGPRAGLDAGGKRKLLIIGPTGNLTPFVQRVSQHPTPTNW